MTEMSARLLFLLRRPTVEMYAIIRATGIADYLTNDGQTEVAQRMAGHSNAKTTVLLRPAHRSSLSVGAVDRTGI